MIFTLASILRFPSAFFGQSGGSAMTGGQLATSLLLMVATAGVTHWFTRRKDESEADANYAHIYSELIQDLRTQIGSLQERVGTLELQVLAEKEASRKLERYVKVLVNLLRRHDITPPTMDEAEADVGV